MNNTRNSKVEELYSKYKERINAQAHELRFCLENNYNDSMKCITPWMRKMWKNSNKDWFEINM